MTLAHPAPLSILNFASLSGGLEPYVPEMARPHLNSPFLSTTGIPMLIPLNPRTGMPAESSFDWIPATLTWVQRQPVGQIAFAKRFQPRWLKTGWNRMIGSAFLELFRASQDLSRSKM